MISYQGLVRTFLMGGRFYIAEIIAVRSSFIESLFFKRKMGVVESRVGSETEQDSPFWICIG
ncbi:hypothetical protein AWN70_24935 [Escherichia coli]|nr:hypothetical protein AWN70_24935 [Escherichia coli]